MTALPDGAAVGYGYASSAPSHAHGYLLPALRDVLARIHPDRQAPLFDLGCGNGAVAAELTRAGYRVAGVDPSREGIARANAAHPGIPLVAGNGYDDLAARFGTFRTVYSLEVVEHVYAPRAFARTLAGLVAPGGHAIVSTPYHGYWKNLALALSGGMDRHFTALWDHGHIKFWSITTLSALMEGAGLEPVACRRIGRLPPFAKSMMLVCRKPGGDR